MRQQEEKRLLDSIPIMIERRGKKPRLVRLRELVNGVLDDKAKGKISNQCAADLLYKHGVRFERALELLAGRVEKSTYPLISSYNAWTMG